MSQTPKRPSVSNPVTGVSLHEIPGEEEEGTAEIRLQSGAQGPAEHVHRTTEERFTVTEGTVTFRIDGRERDLDPETEVRVSPGTPHTFRNEGAEPAAIHVQTVPPNDRLGEVVTTLFGLAHEGAVNKHGQPRFLRAMAMAEATLDETYFTGVPYSVQRTLGEAIGPLARALGYNPVEERFLNESFWRERKVKDEPPAADASGDAQ